jgi:protein CWC15
LRAETCRELHLVGKCRAEKEEEKAKQAAEEAAKARKEEEERALKNNPVLRQELGLEDEPKFQVKRRWDDDVVFKNQARTEPKRAKRFINDTVRSDFHKKFLDRYVK